MLLQTIRTVFAPHTIAFLCKLCAIIAIVGFATGGFTTGLMLNVYIYAARCATKPPTTQAYVQCFHVTCAVVPPGASQLQMPTPLR